MLADVAIIGKIFKNRPLDCQDVHRALAFAERFAVHTDEDGVRLKIVQYSPNMA